MPRTVEEVVPIVREITFRRPDAKKEAQPSAEPPVENRRGLRLDLHVGTSPTEKKLLKLGYMVLAIMSSLLGIASLAFTIADIWWSLTGPVEFRAEFQGLALMGVLTCSLAWAGAAAIGRLLLEPPEEARQRLPKRKA